MSISYRVEVSEAAEVEADQTYLWLLQRSPEAADRWYRGLLEAYRSLEAFPYRFPAMGRRPDVRRMLYGKYGVLFRIVEPVTSAEEPVVRILHIHHVATVQSLDAADERPER